MLKRTKLKIIALFIFLVMVLTIGGGATYLLSRLFHLDEYKDMILQKAEETLHREVTYREGAFSLRHGPSFTFTGVDISEPDRSSTFISAKKLVVKISFTSLLDGELVVREVLLDSPQINVKRGSDGVINFADLLKPQEDAGKAAQIRVKRIRIENGHLKLVDRHPRIPVALDLEKIDLFIRGSFQPGDRNDLKMSTVLVDGNNKSFFSCSGIFRLPEKGAPWQTTFLQAKVIAKDLNPQLFYQYYRPHLPFEAKGTKLDLSGQFKGTFSQFKSKGTFTVGGLAVNWPVVFPQILMPRSFRVSYDMETSPSTVNVTALEADIDTLHIKGSCRLGDLASADILLDATTEISTFQLNDVRPYVPLGIIPHETAEFIDKKIPQATVTVHHGRLHGRISQIRHMGSRNYSLMHIKGEVDDAIVDLGNGTPRFQQVAGDLEFTDHQFVLIGMTGKFGSSPFSLDGKIVDYAHAGTTYPFEAEFHPRAPEVAWLLREPKDLIFEGDSLLHLKGNGPASRYELIGEWDATSANYHYRRLFAKPAGIDNAISFSSVIAGSDVNLSSFTFKSQPLNISANGHYTGGAKPYLQLQVGAETFNLAQTRMLVPLLHQYKASGSLGGALQLAGNPHKPETLKWQGTGALKNVAFVPRRVGAVRDITGNLSFHGNVVETPLMSVRVGNSMAYCKGKMSVFTNPSFNLIISAPELRPSDLGIAAPGGLTFRNVDGDLELKDGLLQVNSLSTRINRSVIEARGTVENLDNPTILLALSSPHLVVDDLLPLFQPGTGNDSLLSFTSLTASLKAEEGEVGPLPFKKLQTMARIEKNRLKLDGLIFSTLEGKVYAEGDIDFSDKDGPRYYAEYMVSNVNTAKLLQLLQFRPGTLTGALSFDGWATASGKSLDNLKRSADGTINLRIADGSMVRSFRMLSKVFSILNVSQLLRLRLPDLGAEGFHFSRMTATLFFRNGIASTDDFFISSDSMNISAVGTTDYLREQLDLVIGVQPLQTLDRVVNKIPVVGWILTGSDKAVVSAYFEAKGTWQDPQVRAIPVSSMARGVFDVFKRTFQVPAKIFTNPQELLGQGKSKQ